MTRKKLIVENHVKLDEEIRNQVKNQRESGLWECLN